jgi:hypothetical protein
VVSDQAKENSSTMTTTRRTRTFAKVGSAAGGLGLAALAALAVLGFSNAAFSATTENNGNNWAADDTPTQITLTANQAADAPLFSFGLDGQGRPSSDGVELARFDNYLATDFANLNDSDDDVGRQVEVTYTGDRAANVRMYVDLDGATISDELADATLVTVSRGATVIHDAVPLSDIPTAFGEATSSWEVPAAAGSAPKTPPHKPPPQHSRPRPSDRGLPAYCRRCTGR